MPAPWEAAIRSLRRRTLVAGALRSVGRLLLPGALLALTYYAAAHWSPRLRYFAPHLGGAGALLLVFAALIGWWRARARPIYFAKAIDLASNLDDRLASSVEWSHLAEPDAFQRRCVEQLSLDLGARRVRLILPPTRPPRLWLTFAAAATVAAVALVQVRQPARPIERNAREKVVLSHALAQAAAERAAALQSDALVAADPEFEQAASELASLTEALGQGRLDRESSLAQLEQLRRRAEQVKQRTGRLGEIGAGDPRGPVGALARAVAAGQSEVARKALGQLAAALASGALGDEDLSRLEPVIQALAGLAGEPGELSEALTEAARRLAAGDQPSAAKAIARAVERWKPLEKPLGTLAAALRMDETLAALERAAAREQTGAAGPALPSSDRAASDADPTEGLGVSKSASNSGTGAGAEAATEHGAPSPIPEGSGGDLQVPGVWSGKVLRQFFDTSSASAPTEEARRLLVEHERVVEDRFRHDEIPVEYQNAVRAYFAALHRKR